jgi:hypothetical protein
MGLHNPKTKEEWQEVTDLCHGLRAIEDCRMYGLLSGGMTINLARVDELLEQCKKRGFQPSLPVEQLAGMIVASFNALKREKDERNPK